MKSFPLDIDTTDLKEKGSSILFWKEKNNQWLIPHIATRIDFPLKVAGYSTNGGGKKKISRNH